MKGLVSFTLFGEDQLYLVGALRQTALWADSDLDVDLRFYCGNSVPEYYRNQLEFEGAQVIRKSTMKLYPWEGATAPEDQTSTFWRHQAFADSEGYEYVLMRDVDSRPGPREFGAIKEWLDSGKNFHIIRDHPYHGVPILAGLWGARGYGVNIAADYCPDEIPTDFYKEVMKACRWRVRYESNDFYQVDQWWLRMKMYPQMKNGVLAHDAFFGFERQRFRHHLPDRIDNEFIGEGFTEFEEPRFPEHKLLLTGNERRKN